MKPTPGISAVPLLIVSALLAAAGVGEAIAPLPQTRIDEVYRETPGRIERLGVLASMTHAELADPLSVDFGLGYFAMSVRELGERFGIRSAGRTPERRLGDLPILPEPFERPFEKRGNGNGSGSLDGNGNGNGIGNGGGNGNGNGNGNAIGNGNGFGLPSPTVIGEVREPSASALFMIGMLGLLVAVRTRKLR